MMRVATLVAVLVIVGSSAALRRAPKYYSAHSGHVLVRNDQVNVTDRDFIELHGWTSPDRNTPCGHAARLRLENLIASGKIFLDDPETLPAHREGRGRYAIAYNDEGESLYKQMVREGLAAVDEGETNEQLLTLAEEARRQGAGCNRGGNSLSIWETSSDKAETSLSQKLTSLRELLLPSLPTSSRQSARLVDPSFESSTWPTGFTTELYVDQYIRRPVDFLWTPDGVLMIALNEGLVLTVENRRLRTDPYMDVTRIVNTFQDRGLMSFAIPPNYRQDPWLFLFIVYEHDTRATQYERAKSSRVMKVRTNPSGIREDASTRTTILGTLNGPGCDAYAADSDCIPTEGKSHVGGALAFRSDGNLHVSVGDGAIAIVTDVAMRAQRFGIYSGKVLLIDQEGRGLRSNPFFRDSVDSRDSKIYAWGTRNIFGMHVDPDNDELLYAGDTQWNDMEEVNIIRRGQNYGWPCYESFLERPEYRDDRECRSLGDNHVSPLVAWRHRGGTGSSMIGEKIRIAGWPQRYQNVLTYGDMAQRFIGLCRVDENGNLVENMERINIPDAAVQFRAREGDGFYYLNVRDRGELRRVSYRPSSDPVSLDRQYPAPDSVVPQDAGLRISARFTRSVEPETVANNVRLEVASTGQIVRSTLSFDFPSRLFTLTVNERLPAGAVLTIVVNGGFGGVRDLDRNVLGSDLSWNFRTEGQSDTARPVVDGTVPSRGAVDVPLTDLIRVSFSEPMRAASVTSSFTIHRASSGAPSGSPLPTQNVAYSEAARELSFGAALTYSTQYVVTVNGEDGGATDLAGNSMRGSHTFTFTTLDSSDEISIEILEPAEGHTVSVGDRVQFRGRATLSSGAPVPASAFTWEYNILHCAYENDNECHDHDLQIIAGTDSGEVVAADHLDRFRYELKLSVVYGSESGVATRQINLFTPDITLQSVPDGIPLSLNGYTRAAPFTLPVAMRSTMQLFAPATSGDYEFDYWAHGGERTQNIVIQSGAVYVAHYRRTGAPQAPFVQFASTPDVLPLSGSVTVLVDYYTPVEAVIRANLRQLDPFDYLFGGQLRVPPGEGSVRVTIPYGQDLALDTAYTILLVLREPAGPRINSASALVRTSGGEASDEVVSLSLPELLPLSGAFSVTVAYQASMDRELVVSVRNIETGTYDAIQHVQVSYTAGVGRREASMTLRNDLVRGQQYMISAALRPVGGRGRDRLDAVRRTVVA